MHFPKEVPDIEKYKGILEEMVAKKPDEFTPPEPISPVCPRRLCE